MFQNVRGPFVTLTILVGDEAPSEFRIFTAGWNKTSKGSFLFDATAARMVMSEYALHGADGMIDLEHLSLEDTQQSRNFDPDARGWYRLELRNGELWAVDVKWTPDGVARLSDKRQRYISPAFMADPKTKRITSLLNVAITALPATHGLTPLVAATERHKMADQQTPELDLPTVLQGLGVDSQALISALGLASDANIQDLAAAVDMLGDKLMGIAGLADPVETPDPNATDPAAMGSQPQHDPESQAMRDSLMRETGAPTILQALSQVAIWKASHIRLEEGEKKLARERLALEAGERKELIARLVKCGAETPHTSGLATGKIAKRLQDEPIAELRDRVKQIEAMRGPSDNGSPKTPKPPAAQLTMVGGKQFEINGQTIELSARELRFCSETGAKPEDYAENKAIHLAAKKGAA
jgi:Mu-like prophage I protein